eukprot:Mrub_01020.p1 GENE.Mrub_01020~~Mrub_01020.p1  ORF type:complete len:623 (-),score=267.43 Mrub_01020:196-2064(-)
MNLSTRFVSDISEILEQIISNKIDSQLATKCKKMNHYLRYIIGDSYYYYMYGSPEDDSAAAARSNGPKKSSEKLVPNQKVLGSLKHELLGEGEGKVIVTRKLASGRPKSKDPLYELDTDMDNENDMENGNELELEHEHDKNDSRVESAERSDLDFDPGYRRTSTRSRTQLKNAENGRDKDKDAKDKDKDRDQYTPTSKETSTANSKKDKQPAPAARELREREPRDYNENKDLPLRDSLRESSLKDRHADKVEKNEKGDKTEKGEKWEGSALVVPSTLPRDKAPASDEAKGSRHCFKVKYHVDNEFIQALADCAMDCVQVHTLPYFNTKSPHNTVKFRVERGGDRLCKIYNLAFYQSDYELLLDVVESFYRPCAKKKWLSAELPFIDEQIRLMRQRLAAAGLSVYAHKVKTETPDDEQPTQPLTQQQKSPQGNFKPADHKEKDADDKDRDRDRDEYESADSLKDATCSNAQESQPEPDATTNKNWFGRDFYEHVRAMNLNDYRLPFSTISKNKSSMQCRIKRASVKLEKKFHYINYSSFYDYIHAYFSKFFLKAIEKDFIQTDIVEYDSMIEWLQRMDRQQKEHNEQQDQAFNSNHFAPHHDEMADDHYDHYDHFKLANHDGL